MVDSNIATVYPSKFLETLPERREARLRVSVARGAVHEYADAPHRFGRLRPGTHLSGAERKQRENRIPSVHPIPILVVASLRKRRNPCAKGLGNPGRKSVYARIAGRRRVPSRRLWSQGNIGWPPPHTLILSPRRGLPGALTSCYSA